MARKQCEKNKFSRRTGIARRRGSSVDESPSVFGAASATSYASSMSAGSNDLLVAPDPIGSLRGAQFGDNVAELCEVIGDLWSMMKLRMYSSSPSTDLAGIQCRLTTIALCSLRDTVR